MRSFSEPWVRVMAENYLQASKHVPGKWWIHCTRKCSKTKQVRLSVTWFSGKLGSAGLAVGLNDLKDLLQSKLFYYSLILFLIFLNGNGNAQILEYERKRAIYSEFKTVSAVIQF